MFWIRIQVDSNPVRNQKFCCAGLHMFAAPVSSNNEYSLKQAVPEPMFSVLWNMAVLETCMFGIEKEAWIFRKFELRDALNLFVTWT